MSIFLGVAIAPLCLFVLQVAARAVWLLIRSHIKSERTMALLTKRIW